MSKRRHPGEIVRKAAGGAFGVDAGRFLIHPEWKGYANNPCMLGSMCDQDPMCIEWANCEEIGDDGKPTGRFAYHVSECRMEDDWPTGERSG